MTFTAGSVLTAAQLNQQLRDNMLETSPAKATAGGQIFVSTSANTIEARVPRQSFVSAAQATTSAAYGDLATVGPTVANITTGTQAIVIVSAKCETSLGFTGFMSHAVSGATVIAATDNNAFANRSQAGANPHIRASAVELVTGLTPGVQTFTAKYRVSTAPNAAQFENRALMVIPL
jgi:hypothetical protein